MALWRFFQWKFFLCSYVHLPARVMLNLVKEFDLNLIFPWWSEFLPPGNVCCSVCKSVIRVVHFLPCLRYFWHIWIGSTFPLIARNEGEHTEMMNFKHCYRYSFICSCGFAFSPYDTIFMQIYWEPHCSNIGLSSISKKGYLDQDWLRTFSYLKWFEECCPSLSNYISASVSSCSLMF